MYLDPFEFQAPRHDTQINLVHLKSHNSNGGCFFIPLNPIMIVVIGLDMN